MDTIDKSLSVTEAAALCGVGRTTVGYWIRSNKLPANRKGELKDAAENWPRVLDEWRAVLERLGSAFRAGRAEVDPKNGPATCRNSHCELAALCRIHERAASDPGGDVTPDGGEQHD